MNRYSKETLAAYRENPRLVEEHANLERAAIEGGYGRRQLFELIQNGADELIGSRGRVQVVLTDGCLYCANEGKPLTEEGAGALLSSHLSPKKGVEIGRFGLGFKSVLGITSRPSVFSTSGSLGFDPGLSRERIQGVVGAVERVPTLRIGVVLDAEAEAEKDAQLGALMSWATTVVKLPRDAGDSEWLTDDMQDFPEQFLLFSRHVAELVLDDQTAQRKRTIRSQEDGDDFVLEEGKASSRWRVYTTEHHPSAAARKDGGAMADRDRVPLVWAVPTTRGRRGQFWAFFPTLDYTTLSGVVNAPWKLNEDRTRVIEGPFNLELIEETARVVIESLEGLCPPDDPGVLLELLPGRGREAAGWADQSLTQAFNDRAKFEATVPDQEGQLQFPAKTNLHPGGIPRSVLDLWSNQPTRPLDWAHASVEATTTRRARVEMYMEPKRPATIREWLEALVEKGKELEGSIAALRVAGALLVGGISRQTRDEPSLLDQVRSARIILDEEGKLVNPSDTAIFVRAPLPLEVKAHYVHREVAAADGVRAALDQIGIPEIDSERLLAATIAKFSLQWKAAEWDVFWNLVRRCSDAVVQDLLARRGLGRERILVRNRNGDYRPMISLLLPGEIVQDGSAEDHESTIDVAFHASELRLLRAIGATSGPSAGDGSMEESTFKAYARATLKDYSERLAGSGAAPSQEYLEFRSRRFAGPLEPLTTLAPRARMGYTMALLNAAADLEPWTFHHRTQSRYPERRYPNPVVSAVQEHGILRTTLGARTSRKAVSSELSSLKDVFPVALCSETAAKALSLPASIDAITPEQWDDALERVRESDDDVVLGMAYGLACVAGVDPPDMIRCRVGSGHDLGEPSDVSVTSDPELIRVLADMGEPYLSVGEGETAAALVERWGMREAGSAVRSEVSFVPSGEPEALGDVFPMLRLKLSQSQRELSIVRCSELRIEHFTDTGRSSTPKTVHMDAGAIYVRQEVENEEFLQRLSKSFGLDLDHADVDAIIRNLDEQKVNQLRASIRKADDDAGRLQLAVGADALRSHLPRSLLSAVEEIEGPLDDRAIGELALVVHGVDVLREHAETLEERGLAPPQTWRGGRSAARFVRQLGFGSEYAGFESRKLDRTLEVEGPPQLGPLHDYQEIVVRDIRAVLRGDGGLRGLLSLPTGAGKTRVTIEALIESMVEENLGSPILWIAQTEELCEQAVQTWSELWRALGPSGRRLTISRLWSSFEADEVEHGDQVVVATISKLASRVFQSKAYDWLAKSSCLVVDEAHTSIGPSYTRVLEWQGMPSSKKTRVPLIGLTATPFRGTNEPETRRLVSRYGERRLDLEALGGADAYPHLQEMGILSHVDHELLPGSEIELSEDELERLRTFQRLPEEPLRRLGSDVERNRTLLESISSLDNSWPALLFAVSVEHAQTMAALLTREGIAAAAITGEMDRSIRRYYIEQFRRGTIRVLTNYAVLAAGFDAPKVRALYVARPTYAPNIYQQMIGRGLRGPRNGGTERCLLVNVADNVARFEDQLAFHEFDYLWEQEAGAAV